MAEDDTAAASAERSSHATPQPPAADRSKGTFLPLVFGGAAACALGFFGGQLDSVEQALGWGNAETSGLRQIIDAQAQSLAAQADQIEAQSAALSKLQESFAALPEPTQPVDADALKAGLTEELAAEFSAPIGALEGRLSTLEKRPMTEGVSQDAVAAYEEELARLTEAARAQRAQMDAQLASAVANYDAQLAATAAQNQQDLQSLRSALEAKMSDIESLLAAAQAAELSAQEQAVRAKARAALTQIITAVESGAPYADALAELDAAGGVAIPEALRPMAETGVPTSASLLETYPDIARAALRAARSEEAQNGEGGLGAFLQRQLGARSTAPQDGDSADAILSRAEAAVRAGRLGDALTELDSLTGSAREAVTSWTAQASQRHSARAAADQLMTELSTN